MTHSGERSEPHFAPLLAGALAIGHRPPLRKLAAMREVGVTHVATILSATENPGAIEAAARKAGLTWIWIELGSTKNLPSQRNPQVAEGLWTLAVALDAGARIYLHCSAGIHRTGMIAAALLFHLGRDEAQVREILAAMRPVTAQQMGEQRFAWARAFASAPNGA